MIPIRIFLGREVLLPGYFAEYPYTKSSVIIKSITKEEFERFKAQGIPVTGWYVKRRKFTLWDFEEA